ncbi:MAG: hypothetical protein J6Y26_06365 [Lachnospiraceae bacterium]|nr:hypothetical protein [Lachnospiraceae bacterium]
MKGKKDKFDAVAQVIVAVLLAVLAVGTWVGIEYGRYMYMAPDGMDFSTFLWVETMRR